MKKYVIVVFAAVIMFSFNTVSGIKHYVINSNKAIIAWQRNTEDDLAGYRVYFGPASRQYTKHVSSGLDTFYVFSKDIIPADSIYAAVTAFDTANNESQYSEEVVVVFNESPVDSSNKLFIDASQLIPGPNAHYEHGYMGIYGRLDSLDWAKAHIDTFLSSKTIIHVKAHGKEAKSVWPIIVIGHDSATVSTPYDSLYTFSVMAPDTAYDIKIKFVNDYWVAGVADRNVYIKSVTIEQDATWQKPVADLNGDGTVDGSDLVLFSRLFIENNPKGDFNGDGFVDGTDLIILARAFIGEN